MIINETKSKVVVFGNIIEQPRLSVFNNKMLDIVTEDIYKYLVRVVVKSAFNCKGDIVINIYTFMIKMLLFCV